MGRRSTKENKSIYQEVRENAGFTREAVEDSCPGLTSDRLVKIEGGKSTVQPEDVVLMSECYREPSLCDYYCSNECAIGRGRFAPIEPKELGQITLETLNALNRLAREKDRLLEIAEDGTVRPDEKADFLEIKKTLDKISVSVRTLQLWVDDAIAKGKLPKDFLG